MIAATSYSRDRMTIWQMVRLMAIITLYPFWYMTRRKRGMNSTQRFILVATMGFYLGLIGGILFGAIQLTQAVSLHRILGMRVAIESIEITPMNKSNSSVASLITNEARRYGVPRELALAIAHWETGMQHFDRHGRVKRSSADALGVFQLKAATAKDMGVDPYDMADNIKGGVKYIAYLKSHFEKIDLSNYSVPAKVQAAFRENPVQVMTIAAYHAGLGRIQSSKGIPNQPGGSWSKTLWTNTLNYVEGVTSLTQRM